MDSNSDYSGTGALTIIGLFFKKMDARLEISNTTPSAANNVTDLLQSCLSSDLDPEKRSIYVSIIKVGAPLLILTGTIANTFLFIVMLRPSIRPTMTSHYLRVLAVFDTCLLWIGYSRHWIWIVYKFDIRNLSNVVCIGHRFLVYWSGYFTAWLLVCVTVERLIGVIFPRFAHLNTSRSPRKITCCVILPMGIALAITCGHFLWSYDLQESDLSNPGQSSCKMVPSWRYVIQSVWPWIDFTVYSLVPFMIITLSNILIISTIRRLRFKTSVHTWSLVFVSTAFLLTTCPYTIYQILHLHGLIVLNCDVREMWDNIMTFLYFSNNAINFFIYCLCSSRFRGEFIKMFKKESERLRIVRVRELDSYDQPKKNNYGAQAL